MQWNKLSVMLVTLSFCSVAHGGLEPDIHPAERQAPAVSAPPNAVLPLSARPPEFSTTVPADSYPRTRLPLAAFASFGQSDGKVLVAIIGAAYHFDVEKAFGERGLLKPRVEFELSYWQGVSGHTGIRNLHETGLTAFGRYQFQRSQNSTIRPYTELGLGLHYITEDRIESKELGRNWLAGSNIGAGILIGRNERLEAGIRIRHLSNAGTDEINWGVNQILGRLALRF